MDKYDRSIFAREQAESLNCDILETTDTTLLLDIDTDAQYKVFMHVYPELCLVEPFASYEVLPSLHGNRHIIVQLSKPLDIYHRLLLHCLLGSDPMREKLSLARYLNGDDIPSLLFRPRKAVD